MPITINPASHPARAYPNILPANDQLNLLHKACPKECSRDTEILTSSFENLKQEDNIVASSGSFLRGAIEAWAHHLHLVLRPEDIWFAILVQLNFYMAANAEKLRHLFVDHKGKKRIALETNEMNAHTVKELLGQFSAEIQRRIKTDWMFDWIMPDFSTTTPDDKMTANILMMGLMQSYFSYFECVTCGIPSITLLGNREDWIKLVDRLDKLPEFGSEPTEFASRLRPILTRFVRSFDEPRSRETRRFWNCIVRADPENESGAPPYRLSGWLMGFCHWNAAGKPMPEQPLARMAPKHDRMELDGIMYPMLDITDVPVGYAKASVNISDWPGHYDTQYAKIDFPGVVVAGALGKRISPGAPLAKGSSYTRSAQQQPTYETTGVQTENPMTKISILGCLRALLPASWRRNSHDDRKQKKPKVGGDMRSNTKESMMRTIPAVSTSNVVPLHEQGTLQPASGWFLFGPVINEPYTTSDPELETLELYFSEDHQWRMEHKNDAKFKFKL